jgi:hypothetical protein
MKKIVFLILGFSCSVFALQDNPIAPPKVEISDKFGVNLQSTQLARNLKTVSIGGELGLSHHVQLYTDLFSEGNYWGFVDAFAGSLNRKNISQNIVSVMGSPNPMYFRDTGSPEYDHTKRISVMRAYGPAGSQDFLVYQNDVLDRDASSTTEFSTLTGLTFKAVGDARHTLVLSADKTFYTWTTPDGTESKYSISGMRLVEVTYPNGFKNRVDFLGVTTNTGFMLKYRLNTQQLSGTPDQIVAINRANQYCAVDATSCSNAGWPTATFTWPVGTPSNFWTPGLPLSSYLIKLATPAGVTDIQYQPENLCITDLGTEDAYCGGHQTGWGKWSSRLRSIKTPESTIPNYQYTYKNTGAFHVYYGGIGGYWVSARVGQVVTATLNGTDQNFYGGPSVNNPGASTRYSSRNGVSEISVESAQYDLNVINKVTTKSGGFYVYHKDLRNLVEFFTPIQGLGPKQHYYYGGPRGNLNKIAAVDASGNETTLQEVLEFESDEVSCSRPKTCNKPKKIQDARGNITEYKYDSEGRFGNPIKITGPANKNNVRPTTIYNYEPLYAYYKKDGDFISQDPDPIWMLTSEFTCQTTAVNGNDTGCVGGESDMVKTIYSYGTQSTAQPNNLLLTRKKVTAAQSFNNVSQITSKCTWFEYDKYGNKIGETEPNANLPQCAQ